MRIIEQVVDKQWPYCQHPECHNSRTVDYADNYGTSNGSVGPPIGRIMWFSSPAHAGFPGIRRWCHSHAMLNEGVAFGGAA